MFYSSVAFFVIAFLAAFLGFGASAATFTVMSKVVFYVAFVLGVVSLVSVLMHRV